MTPDTRTRPRRRTFVDVLRGHEPAVGAAILAVGVAAAVIAALSANGLPFRSSYRLQAILPAGAPHVIVGSPVRIAGVYAGSVSRVGQAPGGGQRITLNLRSSPIGRDARLLLRPTSAAGGAYVALARGDFRGSPLPSGATIPAAQVSSTEDLATLVDGFGRAALSDMRGSTALAGGALLDRGAGLNEAVLGLGTTLAQGRRLLRAASPGDDLTTLVRDGGTTVTALRGRRPDDAGGLVGATADATSQLAAPDAHLGALIDAIPGFEQTALSVLPQADPLLRKTGRLAVALRPAVADLHTALPSLTRVLRSGPVLRGAVPPLAGAAEPALRALAPVLARVGPDAVLLGRGLPFVGQLAAYLSRYPREIEQGTAGYFAVTKLESNVGKAKGFPLVPFLLVLTCAPGDNPDPQPGDAITERKPCRG